MSTLAELPFRAPPLRDDADGVIRIGDTRVTLDTVVCAYLNGSTVEELVARYPALDLADAYAVIAYYLWNREAVDGYLSQRSSDAKAIQEGNRGRGAATGLRDQFLARKRLAS